MQARQQMPPFALAVCVGGLKHELIPVLPLGGALAWPSCLRPLLPTLACAALPALLLLLQA